MDKVKGKVAFVTGARRGLGAAISAMLAREGAKLVLTDRRGDEDHRRRIDLDVYVDRGAGRRPPHGRL